MAWTAPRTWTTGEVVTAAQLNEQIRDNENWLKASAIELLENNTLTSDEASVTFSTNVTGYAHLMIKGKARSTAAAVNDQINMTFNSAATDSYYWIEGLAEEADAMTVVTGTNVAFIRVANICACDVALPHYDQFAIEINDYASSDYKTCHVQGTFHSSLNATGLKVAIISGWWLQEAAITSITLTPASGSFKAGSRFTLYGFP